MLNFRKSREITMHRSEVYYLLEDMGQPLRELMAEVRKGRGSKEGGVGGIFSKLVYMWGGGYIFKIQNQKLVYMCNMFLSHLNRRLERAFSDQNWSVVCCCWWCRKLFTFLSSPSEPLG